MPARFALTIGINYRDSPPGTDLEVQARARVNPLSYAEADAEDLGALLEAEGYEVVRLIGASATRARIIQELTNLHRKAGAAGQEGLLLVHYSGHGVVDSHDDLGYLLPADGDPENLPVRGILLEDLANRYLGRAQSALVLLDCCHSGYAVGFKGPEAVSKDVATFVSLAGKSFDQAPQGRITFAACAGEQLARERRDLTHGIFTYYVLEHWRTNAGAISDATLFEYLSRNMPNQGMPPPVRGGRSQQGVVELRSQRALPQEPVKPSPAPPLAPTINFSTHRVSRGLTPRARAALFQLLIKTVSSANDLSDLAFYAGLDYDRLDSTNLRSSFRGLVAQAEASGRIRQLREAIQQFTAYHQPSPQPEDTSDVAHAASKPLSNHEVQIQAATINAVYAHVHLGRGHFHNHHYEEALAEYNRAIEVDPDCIAAYNGRGDVYYAQHEDTMALAEYNRAIQLDLNNAYAHSGRGRVYVRQDKYEDALAEFDHAIRLDPELADAYFGRGELYFRQEQYKKALEQYNQALQFDPNSAYSYSGRGNVYYRFGQYWQALDEYSRAIKLDSKFATAHKNRGNLYSMLGDYEQALAEYTRAIELDPNLATAHSGLGSLHYDLKNYQQALAEFNRAIELDPNLAAAYNGRGIVYKAYKLHTDALAEFNRAVELDPKVPAFTYNRGTTYSALGLYDKALSDLNRAIELEPTLAIAFRARANVYAKLRRASEAASDRKRAAELGL